MVARLASADAYRVANLELNAALLSLRFAIESRRDKQFIRISSTQPMDDLYVDLLMELSSGNGRIVREYVFLLDPVSLRPAQAALATPENGASSRAGAIQEMPAAPLAAPVLPNSALPASKPATPAAQPAARSPLPVRAAAPVAPLKAPAEGGDKARLTLSLVDAAPGRGASKAAMQELASMQKAVTEANARVKALEEKVTEMQRLLEITNTVLATMQMQNELSAVEKKTLAEAKNTLGAVAKAAGTGEASAVAPAAVSAPAAASAPAAVPAPAAAPKPVAVAAAKAAPPPAKPDLFDEPLLLAGAGMLLAALSAAGVYFFRRRKVQKPFDSDSFTDAVLVADAAPPARLFDAGKSELPAAPALHEGRAQTSEVDAISEADIYIAYGRENRAEAVLQEALKNQPERHALRIKLLSIYAARKDTEAFETLALELAAMTQRAGPDWDQAEAMGRAIDADNPLYASHQPRVADPEPEVELADVLPVEPVAQCAPQLEESGADNADEFETGTMYSAAEVLQPQAEEPLVEEMPLEEISFTTATPASFDLDFEFEDTPADDTPAEDGALPAIPQLAVAEAAKEVAPLDFDFDLPEIPALAQLESEIEDAPSPLEPVDLDMLDFDFVQPKTPPKDKL